MTVTSGASSAAKRGIAAGAPKHFLDIDRFESADLRDMLELAHAYKRGEAAPGGLRPAAGKTLALVFEKPSTRTRVSFEVGMVQMGGHVTILASQGSQLGRGETIADTTRVLNRYVDAIMFRTLSEASLLEMVQYATVPVINGLTDKSHPCQIMADIMTFEEIKGPINGRTIAWVGDGNNVLGSWIHAAAPFGYALRIACPAGYEPDGAAIDAARAAGADIILTADPAAGAAGADCVVTDTWLSMGTDGGPSAEDRVAALTPYRVDEALMARAAKDAIFLHCLPANRANEVSGGVIDGPRSAVWDEAENRLHAQKGILHWCLSA
ncbi:MAG: ornithine carbamoyltransferase [Alphaproteobacteria bacterium]|nr:ornithine carbamoyltransferase [Alphaproteobacteria bacterium]